MKKNIFYLLVIVNYFAFSQAYIPLDTTDFEQRKTLTEKVNNQLENLKTDLKKQYKGNLRKEISFSYNDIFELITDKIKNHEIVFNNEFAEYANNLTSEIIKSNSEFFSNNNISSYIIKHNSPNALSVGNGYVFLNMGLFKFLDNEAQLVSVLCHEIAHDILEHSKNSIINSAKQETSKDKKNVANKIRKQRYNRQKEAFGEFKKILYTNKKKHRAQEIEADSLGFLLFKNTKYKPAAFLSALETLAEIDSLPNLELKKETYAKVFNTKEQPFKEEWMKTEDFGGYNYNHYKSQIDKDSIKSHPEIYDRIDFVKNILAKSNSNIKTTLNSDEFKSLKNTASHEDVLNLFYSKDYGLSTYLTLYKLQKSPENSYHKMILGKNLNAIYKAKKDYKLNRHVDKINPKDQTDSYVQFLNFIWNLRLTEIENFKNHYYQLEN